MQAPLPILLQFPPHQPLESLENFLSSFLKYTAPTPLFRHADTHLLNWDPETQRSAPLQIAQVRTLTNDISLQPFQGIGPNGISLHVIFAIETASVPAQHALLKMLEEPPTYAQIILTTQSIDAVLPTIRSRAKELKFAHESNSTSITSALPSTETITLSSIQTCSISQILNLAETYKERPDAIAFIQQLITTAHRAQQHSPSLTTTQALARLIAAHDHLQHNSNVRLTLEATLFAIKSILS